MDDLISRQAAILDIKELIEVAECNNEHDRIQAYIYMLLNRLKMHLPSSQRRKRGGG